MAAGTPIPEDSLAARIAECGFTAETDDHEHQADR